MVVRPDDTLLKIQAKFGILECRPIKISADNIKWTAINSDKQHGIYTIIAYKTVDRDTNAELIVADKLSIVNCYNSDKNDMADLSKVIKYLSLYEIYSNISDDVFDSASTSGNDYSAKFHDNLETAKSEIYSNYNYITELLNDFYDVD